MLSTLMKKCKMNYYNHYIYALKLIGATLKHLEYKIYFKYKYSQVG